MKYIPTNYVAIFSIIISAIAIFISIRKEYKHIPQSHYAEQNIVIDEKVSLLGDIHCKEWRIKNNSLKPMMVTRLNILVNSQKISLDRLYYLKKALCLDIDIVFLSGTIREQTIIYPNEQAILLAAQFDKKLSSKMFFDVLGDLDWEITCTG